MPDIMRRTTKPIYLGCLAGAIAVLVFHQTTLQVFFWLGLAPQAAFRVAMVPPFHAPMVVSITFWGAVYGGLYGFLASRYPAPLLVRALLAGVFAITMSWFVVGPIAGRAVAFGWHIAPMLRSGAASLMWGLGTAVILPLLYPRSLTGRGRRLTPPNLAT